MSWLFSKPAMLGVGALFIAGSYFFTYQYGRSYERGVIRTAILEKDNATLRKVLEDRKEIEGLDIDGLVDELTDGL